MSLGLSGAPSQNAIAAQRVVPAENTLPGQLLDQDSAEFLAIQKWIEDDHRYPFLVIVAAPEQQVREDVLQAIALLANTAGRGFFQFGPTRMLPAQTHYTADNLGVVVMLHEKDSYGRIVEWWECRFGRLSGYGPWKLDWPQSRFASAELRRRAAHMVRSLVWQQAGEDQLVASGIGHREYRQFYRVHSGILTDSDERAELGE